MSSTGGGRLIWRRFSVIRNFHQACGALVVAVLAGVSMGALAAGAPDSGVTAKGAVSGIELKTDLMPQAEDSSIGAAIAPVENDFVADPYEYRIGPLDLLEIKVLQANDISRTVRVDSRGNISLPLIGIVRAAGLSGYDLEQSIAAKLGSDFMLDPQVSVFIKEYTSQRVTVQGTVKKSGVYDFPGQATLLQAISIAGGLDEKANESAIKVIQRRPDGSTESMSFDMEAIRQNRISNPLLKGGDVVVVEEAQPITVEGAVNKAGIFYPRGHATLMQVISQAGGLQDLADISAIKVYGTDGRNEKTSREYDVEKIRQGEINDPPVHPGDVVVVGKATGRSIIQGVANTLRGFIGFGTVGR